MDSPITSIVITFLFLSFLSSFFTCVYFLIGGAKKLKHKVTRLLFYLSLSDVLASFAWLMMNFFPDAACPYLASVNLFGLVSVSCWTCCIGFHLCCTTFRKDPNELWYLMISWGMATVILTVTLFGDMYYRIPAPSVCWLSSTYMLIYAVPQYMSFAGNIVFLGIIIKKLNLAKHPQWEHLRNFSKRKALRLYFIQLCYFLYTIASVLEFIPGSFNIGMIMASLQGFLNAIAMNGKKLQKPIKKFYLLSTAYRNAKIDGEKVVEVPLESKTTQPTKDLEVCTG